MMRQKYLVVVPTQIKARMVIQIVSVLIDFCWESIEQYFSYISDEIKFNNTVYKNYTAMRGGDVTTFVVAFDSHSVTEWRVR